MICCIGLQRCYCHRIAILKKTPLRSLELRQFWDCTHSMFIFGGCFTWPFWIHTHPYPKLPAKITEFKWAVWDIPGAAQCMANTLQNFLFGLANIQCSCVTYSFQQGTTPLLLHEVVFSSGWLVSVFFTGSRSLTWQWATMKLFDAEQLWTSVVFQQLGQEAISLQWEGQPAISWQHGDETDEKPWTFDYVTRAREGDHGDTAGAWPQQQRQAQDSRGYFKWSCINFRLRWILFLNRCWTVNGLILQGADPLNNSGIAWSKLRLCTSVA